MTTHATTNGTEADSDAPLCRRRLLKLAAGLALAAAPFAHSHHQAAAFRTWCRRDPLYLIGDRIVDVQLGADAQILETTTGPIALEIVVPPGTPVTEVLSDDGFGYGYELTVVESSDLVATRRKTEYQVHAYVPSSVDGLEVAVYVTTVGTATDGLTTLRVRDLLSVQDTAWGVVNTWVVYGGTLTTLL